ncbi:hypothetical protein GIB67_010971 [Kingdonia uniflora]|uniref:WEB family protein n=1 Tax=Kingdonia uniflora TaxID=39325 RepID=A0A7J7MMI0_9MAGN|nr:hypothetical protein GIB67_010971 [Kingdonia uniflora]
MGLWKIRMTLNVLIQPTRFHMCTFKEVDIAKVEEQAALLEKDLIVKELETLEVLKDLESTKKTLEELKLKLQKETAESSPTPSIPSGNTNTNSGINETEKQIPENIVDAEQDPVGGLNTCPTSSPGLILMELKKAKVNLSRTNSDISGIRASVESLNTKIEKERISLKKTHEKLFSNSATISSLEEDLKQTRQKLQLVKKAKLNCNSENPADISKELQELSYEAENFKKMAEAAREEVARAMSEIEQTKTSIKTSEIRWFAAKKMAKAARAAEASAVADIKALSNSEGPSITLSLEEYSSLTRKVREAEELSKKRVVSAMLQIDVANKSKLEILKKVEAANEEVKTSKKAMEVALKRVEAANNAKLSVEEALRRWRSENGQKRRSSYNSTKFKNAHPSHQRKDSRLLDVNGFNLTSDGSKPVLRPTLSIGQILSRKLLLPGEGEMEMWTDDSSKRSKVSLGQMLGRHVEVLSPPTKSDKEGSVDAQKQPSAKKKKFGFAQFSLILAKQNKKKKMMKKKQVPITRWNSCKGGV